VNVPHVQLSHRLSDVVPGVGQGEVAPGHSSVNHVLDPVIWAAVQDGQDSHPPAKVVSLHSQHFHVFDVEAVQPLSVQAAPAARATSFLPTAAGRDQLFSAT